MSHSHSGYWRKNHVAPSGPRTYRTEATMRIAICQHVERHSVKKGKDRCKGQVNHHETGEGVEKKQMMALND